MTPAQPASATAASASASATTAGNTRQPIVRHGTTQRWSDCVVHGGTVYLVEVPPLLLPDMRRQAESLLASVDGLLEKAGSSKAHLLMATLYLQDMDELEVFNAVWDAWLPPGSAPVRCCIEARLANPAYRVEIQLVAALA